MATAIITLIILILLNAFFAASEIALVGLKDAKIRRMAEEGDKVAKMLYNLTSEPSRFLSTIQIGITLAGFLASAFAADFFAEPLAAWLYDLGAPLPLNVLDNICVIFITLVLSYFTLVFGELVPKQLALQKAEAIARFSVYPLTLMFKICLPVVKLLSFSTNSVIRLFGIDPDVKNKEATEEEIRMLVDVGSELGNIEITEKQMINNIFEFNDKVVSEISTHRTEMVVLSVDATLEETVQLVNNEKYTRFPVYEGDIDHIVGILHVKDIFDFMVTKKDKDFDLRKLIRKPHFVFEGQKIDTLFNDMKKNNIHIAIVLDEYGGTEGLVTIEDVIEEIVGDISSEINGPDEKEIIHVSPNQYFVEGTIHLDMLEELLQVKFETEHYDYDTLNGFLIEKIGYMPPVHEHPVIKYKNLIFEVIESDENRIQTVMITVTENNETEHVEENTE